MPVRTGILSDLSDLTGMYNGEILNTFQSGFGPFLDYAILATTNIY